MALGYVIFNLVVRVDAIFRGVCPLFLEFASTPFNIAVDFDQRPTKKKSRLLLQGKAGSLWSVYGRNDLSYRPRTKVQRTVWVRVRVDVRVGWLDARGLARTSAFKTKIIKLCFIWLSENSESVGRLVKSPPTSWLVFCLIFFRSLDSDLITMLTGIGIHTIRGPVSRN